MGLIDSYLEIPFGTKSGNGFQSPSMGLIDSYKQASLALTRSSSGFNPLQWGLLILTYWRKNEYMLRDKVSIPFNGAY